MKFIYHDYNYDCGSDTIVGVEAASKEEALTKVKQTYRFVSGARQADIKNIYTLEEFWNCFKE